MISKDVKEVRNNIQQSVTSSSSSSSSRWTIAAKFRTGKKAKSIVTYPM
jgi:hypothetical protein